METKIIKKEPSEFEDFAAKLEREFPAPLGKQPNSIIKSEGKRTQHVPRLNVSTSAQRLIEVCITP